VKVLIAIDDSKFSQQALAVLARQIPPAGTEIRVLHVLQPIASAPVPQMDSRYAPELEGQGKQARELVERAASTLRSSGFKVETAVEKGDIRLEIIDAAAEWKADLIVVGSHGRTGLPRLLLGSVAEFVARNASCSVEIVRVATDTR
jgi:nucleotide-binding universal stress UspA family protein